MKCVVRESHQTEAKRPTRAMCPLICGLRRIYIESIVQCHSDENMGKFAVPDISSILVQYYVKIMYIYIQIKGNVTANGKLDIKNYKRI